jgi:monofunctional biosynthetic peptidoglycan transglycosylase
LKYNFAGVWRIFKRAFIGVFIFHLLYLIYCNWFNPPITLTQVNSLVQGDGLKRNYVSFENISANAKLAMIASEDQIFPIGVLILKAFGKR